LMKAMTSTARHNEDRRRRPDLSVQTRLLARVGHTDRPGVPLSVRS
jgi:hypothetical protein